jgi:hypothetical protein
MADLLPAVKVGGRHSKSEGCVESSLSRAESAIAPRSPAGEGVGPGAQGRPERPREGP